MSVVAMSLSRTVARKCRHNWRKCSRTQLFSSGTTSFTPISPFPFSPSEPPGTNGTPVFPDIDFSVAAHSPDARRRNEDPNAVMVVTGANRGIGLQFVKSLVERSKGTIVACCREPDNAYKLNEFINSLDSKSQRRVQMLQVDLLHQSSIESAGKRIRDKFKRVDMLLNVAGILGDGRTTPGPERSLANMDRDWFDKTIAVNFLAPVFLTKELFPLITQKRKGSSAEQRPKAVVVNLSARVGSISDNQIGGWYSYRVSKTALNQATRTLAHELKRHSAWAVALHPGTTNTDLSAPFQKNVKEGSLFPVEFTVTQLLNIIDSLQDVHSGGFYDWSGRAISF